jgi:hypothetical protein
VFPQVLRVTIVSLLLTRRRQPADGGATSG